MNHKPYHNVVKRHYEYNNMYNDKRQAGRRLSYVGHGGIPGDGEDVNRIEAAKKIVGELQKSSLPFVYAKWVITYAFGYGSAYKFVILVPK